MCSSQALYQMRFGLAQLLGLPIEKIRLQYHAGSNTYGNSCYGEVAKRGGHSVAGGRQTGPAAAQPRRRARLGQLRPRTALRSACGGRRERQARGARLSGVGPRDRLVRDRVAARARHSAADRRFRRRSHRTGRRRALFGALVADRHVRRPESPNREPQSRQQRLFANRCVARADGPVDVLRARRRDGRARARGASSIRTSSASGTSRTSGGSMCSKLRPMLRNGRRASQPPTCRARESSPVAALVSARTTCRRTRAIASPMPRPSWTSR